MVDPGKTPPPVAPSTGDTDKPHRSPTDAHRSPTGVVSGTIGAAGTLPRDTPTPVVAHQALQLGDPDPVSYECSPERTIAWHRLDYRESMILTQVRDRRGRAEIIAASGLDKEAAEQLFERLVKDGTICPVSGSDR